MLSREKILYEGSTNLDTYKIIDMVYEGRKARVLFSGDKSAAFSGMPLDGENLLLFDYIQRFFELVSHARPKKLLMIGGGVYTLPMALVQALPDIVVDVVEIDAGLDLLAEGFFGYKPHERLRIIHADGKDFLVETANIYDMIIIDAFTDLVVPQSLTGVDAARLIKERLTANGIVAINIISSYKGSNAHIIESFFDLYAAEFSSAHIYPADNAISLWTFQNFILISQKNKTLVTHGLRFGALEPPVNRINK